MTDLYKALRLSRESDVDELQSNLAALLQETRNNLVVADDDSIREQAEDTIILIREAQKQFSDHESKKAYDDKLDAEAQASISRKVREQSKYGGTYEALLDALKEAVEKDNFDEVRSISREFKLQNCETAECYRYMAEAAAKQQNIQAAWNIAKSITEKFGDDGADERVNACIAIAENGLDHNGNLTIIRQAIDYALEQKGFADEWANALDVHFDLQQGNEAMAIQKMLATAAEHPEWEYYRLKAAVVLFSHATKHYTKKDSQGEPYYDSKEDYDNFSRIVHLAYNICPRTVEDASVVLHNEVQKAEQVAVKQVIPPGRWAIAYTLIIGIISLIQPMTRVFGCVLIAMGIIFYIMLRIPKYMMTKFLLTKKLSGTQEIVRIIARIVERIVDIFGGGWTIKLSVKK